MYYWTDIKVSCRPHDLLEKSLRITNQYGDTDECAGGVTVTLNGANTKTKTTTDNFCDFEFEGLSDNTEYTVKIEGVAHRIPELHA
jgi:hypothetical protein